MNADGVEAQVLALTAGEADPAFRRRAAWALARLDLRDGQRVLELGAGIAPLLLLARKLAAIFPVAVDVDLGRLADARRRGFDGAAVVADGAVLPFAPAAFARGIASEVLEHVADDGAALAELRRVVDRGGSIAVTVPHARYPTSWDPVARMLESLGIQPPRRGPYVGIWSGHRRLYERTNLLTLCRETGWEVCEESGLVHGGFPFAHFLLYGVGKRLLEAGLLRGRAVAAVDRSFESAALPPWWHPIGAAIRLLRRADARAERRLRRDRSVHLAVLLRNPDRNQM